MFVPPNLIYPTNVYAGCIYEYVNIWENSEALIKEIENEVGDVNNLFGFVPANILNGDIAGYRTNAHLGITEAARHNDFFRRLNNSFYETVLAATEVYRRRFLPDISALYHEPYNLLRYRTGNEYKAHYDGDTVTRRAVSPILYLNDDYEGGELEFVNFDLKIKPRAGSLYIFPSSFPYAHIAHPVTKGTKYAIVSWLHDGQ